LKKIFIVLIIFNLLIPTKVLGFSYVIMEEKSGRILESSDINNKKLIASITKIMTCIIALENNNNLEKVIKVPNEVLKMYGTNIYIEVGEEIKIIDLLYGLMLRSGNDAALTLAIATAGSEENFVKLMNKKAQELGMNNTIFNNPHGLDEDTKNYSTAYDMSLLARYAYKNKIYRKIIKTKKYTCKSSIKSYLWYNRVSILNNYKYSLGGKNGYTPKAGKTLVSYAKKNNMTLIGVSLHDSNIYDTHEDLFEKNFKKYKLYKIVDKDNFSYNKKLFSEDIYLKESFYYPLKENELTNISTIINITNSNNTIPGKIIIKLNNKEIGSINIYRKKQNKRRKESFFKKIINKFKN